MGNIDYQDFEKLRKELETYESQRELLVQKSREIVILSKQAIHAVQRDQLQEAEKFVKGMEGKIIELRKITQHHGALDYSGSSKIAFQEYVEAVCFFQFVKHKKLPSAAELKVNADYYLLGLCDLTGELVRKAIHEAIAGNFSKALEIKEFVFDVYGELLKFNFRNGELRKKFDGIKYDLKRLEDLALGIKMKERL
ncbi:hypothetical protein HYS48_04870 [Candidatus Woesearchaeota archaeon]|nr:hypothetical protein [Candidatus Woesearchaeota archaeon]